MRELSGGMKRRVMIAKALAHEPKILFLDEPTAGVDVSLRESMWENIERLKNSGVTIILTTHYIEEAEKMADRVGFINQGEIQLVEEKESLMAKFGQKEVVFQLDRILSEVPEELKGHDIKVDGQSLTYRYDSKSQDRKIAEVINIMNGLGLNFLDINTRQSSLEDIFIELVGR